MSKKKKEIVSIYFDIRGERLPVSTLITRYAVLIIYMPHSPVCSECVRLIIALNDNEQITLH